MVATPTSPIFADQQTLTDDEGYDYDASPLPSEGYDEIPQGMEEADGELIEKTGMTLKHGAAQLNLAGEWRNYVNASGVNGKAYTEVACRTDSQKRCPDVSYLTAELLEQYGQPGIFPQSYPLIGKWLRPMTKRKSCLIKRGNICDRAV